MPSTSYFAIDPCGVTHTRTSATRLYTHTVVALPSAQNAILSAKSPGMRAHHKRNFSYYADKVRGTSRWLQRNSWESEEKHNARVLAESEAAEAELDGCDTADQYADMLIAATLARIADATRAGHFEAYQNMGWCGRADLAAKLAAKTQGQAYYVAASVRVLDAQVRA